jgi:hypothetical protein
VEQSLVLIRTSVLTKMTRILSLIRVRPISSDPQPLIGCVAAPDLNPGAVSFGQRGRRIMAIVCQPDAIGSKSQFNDAGRRRARFQKKGAASSPSNLRRQMEDQKITWPMAMRSGCPKMSNRTIALLVLAAVVAAAVTVEVTYFVLDRFVLHDPDDPLTKAGGLSQEQKAKRK